MAAERQRGNDVGPTGATVAYNLKRLRTGAGIDLREVSQRAAKAGRSLSPAALSRIENLDRRVDVDDLVVLALVLDVNPNALLLPPTKDSETLVVLAGSRTLEDGEAVAHHADSVWRWAAGDAPLGLNIPDATWQRMLDAAERGVPRDEVQAMGQPAQDSAAERFRIRVAPGFDEAAGPSVGPSTLRIGQPVRSALDRALEQRRDRG